MGGTIVDIAAVGSHQDLRLRSAPPAWVDDSAADAAAQRHWGLADDAEDRLETLPAESEDIIGDQVMDGLVALYRKENQEEESWWTRAALFFCMDLDGSFFMSWGIPLLSMVERLTKP